MAHQKLIKDTFLTLITLVTFGSTNFLFNVVVGRVFGSAYLGMVSAALSTIFLMSYVISTSFPGAVAKYVSEYLGKNGKKEANYVFILAIKYAILIGIILTGIALIFARQISSFFNIPINIFIIAIPLLFLYGIYMILKMAYYGYRDVRAYFKNELIADTLFLFSLGLIGIIKWNGYIYFPYVTLYAFFIIFSIGFFKRKITKNRIKNKNIKNKLLVFAGISFIGTFSSMAMRSLSIMLSSKYVSPNQVGYLSAALSVSMIFFLFPNAIGRVFMPEFSYHFGRGNKTEIEKLLNKSTEYLAVLVTIINGLGIIFAPIIIWLFYSSEFKSAVLIFQILLLAFWFTMVGRPAVSVLSGTKYIHIPNIGGLLGLSASLISWVFLIPKYGILGTAIGFFIGISSTMIFIFMYTTKLFNFKLKNIFLKNIWLIFIFIITTPFLYNGDILYKVIIPINILILFTLINRKIIKNIIRIFYPPK